MTPNDLNKAFDLMQQIWPKQVDKLTKEQKNTYWIALSKYPIAAVMAAIRIHAAKSRFTPKPVDLDEIAQKNIEPKQRIDPVEQQIQQRKNEWNEHVKQVRIEKEEIDKTLQHLTTEQLTKHRMAVVQANPILSHILNDPLNTQMTRTFIAERIINGLENDFTTGIYHGDHNQTTFVKIDPKKNIQPPNIDNLFSFKK